MRWRDRWKAHQGRLDPARLVTAGDKLVAKALQGWWRTLTFLAALRCDRITAPCVIDGPINGEIFLASVEQLLVPTLRPGDIVIIDNLGSHKGKPVRQVIRRRRSSLMLPQDRDDLFFREP